MHKPLIVILVSLLISVTCLAETQAPSNRGRQVLFPERHKCLDLIELENVKLNPQTHTLNAPDAKLYFDYRFVAEWLRGYFTAWNNHPDTDHNVTKDATIYQIMTWIVGYCRANPSADLEEAAQWFMAAMNKAKQ